MAFLYLLIAVIAEVLATSALKATNGFTAPLPVVLTIIGYAIALFFLGLTFKSIPMGLAYALWSGAGIILCKLFCGRRRICGDHGRERLR